MAENSLPSDMLLDDSAPVKFSLTSTATRASFERLYISASPQSLSKAASYVKAIYDWEDPLYTGSLALLYFLFWSYDILPALFCSIAIYCILERRFNPPSSSLLKIHIREQRRRTREVEELERDMERRAQLGVLGSSILASVGAASMIGASATSATTSSLLPRSHSTETLETSETPIEKGDKGLFRLIRDVSTRFGPSVQILLEDSADLIEKAKNYFLWRNTQNTRRLLCLHVGLTFWFLMVPPRLVLRVFWAYIGK